jgi:Zn-dependent protease
MHDISDLIFKLSVMLVPAVFAIVCHEVSHGYIAYKLGDPTAKNSGRLTLNPLKHIDPIGLIMLYIFKIGWAKPVPVTINNLRNPKRDMIWVAAAGPVTNLLLASVSAITLRGIIVVADIIPRYFAEPLLMMLAFSVFINLILAIFNMIPLPPLDGGRVLVGLLPPRQAIAFSKIEPFGMFAIILVVVFFPLVIIRIIYPPLYMGLDFMIGTNAMNYLLSNTNIARLGFLHF